MVGLHESDAAYNLTSRSDQPKTNLPLIDNKHVKVDD